MKKYNHHLLYRDGLFSVIHQTIMQPINLFNNLFEKKYERGIWYKRTFTNKNMPKFIQDMEGVVVVMRGGVRVEFDDKAKEYFWGRDEACSHLEIMRFILPLEKK